MLRIAIVDDEAYYQELLKNNLKEQLEMIFHLDAEIHCFASAKDFLDAWHAERFQLVFFDIYLGDENGIEIANQVRNEDTDVKFVFCSTSNEFGPESYKVNASYYLHKPLTADSLLDALNRVDLRSLIQTPTLILPNGMSVSSSAINYSTFSNHVFTLYFRNGTHYTYPSAAVTQKEMTAKLQALSDTFIPIDRSTIINLESVAGIEDNRVFLSPSSDMPLYISRAKKKEVKNAYMHYTLKNLHH